MRYRLWYFDNQVVDVNRCSTVGELFNVVPAVLLAASVLTFIALVREVFPHLPPEDRASLRSIGPPIFRQFRVRDSALGRAWDVHAKVFPKSHKRQLFAGLLIATALSVFGYAWVPLK